MRAPLTTHLQTDPERELDVVRAVYAAFAAGDVPALLALVSSSVVVSQSPALPWGGEHHGHAGLLHFLGVLTAHLDSQPETERLYADGAGVVVQVGRTRGVVRATGTAFDVPETHLWTLLEGEVVAFSAFLDTPALREALDGGPAAQQQTGHDDAPATAGR